MFNAPCGLCTHISPVSLNLLNLVQNFIIVRIALCISPSPISKQEIRRQLVC